MELQSTVFVEKETEDSNIFSRNSEITQILQVVFNQSDSENEIESILLNFWGKYHNHISEERLCYAFDFLSMYILDYVYKRNGPTQSAVSKSLYWYLKRTNLNTDLNATLNQTDYSFLKELREFTDFSSEEGEDILIDALIKSLFDGNFGLLKFLLKFGLVQFPSEANEKSRKILIKLVDRFNDSLLYIFLNDQEERRRYIVLHELLDLLQQSGITFRRSLLIFSKIILISVHILYEKMKRIITLPQVQMHIEQMVCQSFTSQNILLEATSEATITFKDIEIFTEKCLNPLLNEDFGKFLVAFSRVKLCKSLAYLNPRSLNDLTRCAIRANFQSSMTFPAQVSHFDIPASLKKFLIFHAEEIFDWLRTSHLNKYIREQIKLLYLRNLHADLEN